MSQKVKVERVVVKSKSPYKWPDAVEEKLQKMWQNIKNIHFLTLKVKESLKATVEGRQELNFTSTIPLPGLIFKLYLCISG